MSSGIVTITRDTGLPLNRLHVFIALPRTDEVLAQMRSESAIGAFTTPEQVAWAMQMLLAPEADVLAGGTLFMDAGRRKGLP